MNKLLIVGSLVLIGSFAMPTYAGSCFCGWNPQEYCEGTTLHHTSDCYDMNTNQYCGDDDQEIGTCRSSGNLLSFLLLKK